MNTSEKVISVISRISGVSDIKQQTKLIDELMLDSLMMVSMLIELEDRFSIEFNESDMNPYDLKTVGDAVELVVRYVGK